MFQIVPDSVPCVKCIISIKITRKMLRTYSLQAVLQIAWANQA